MATLPEGFDPLKYLQLNPDLVAAYGWDTNQATNHYLNWGAAENRNYGQAGWGGTTDPHTYWANSGLPAAEIDRRINLGYAHPETWNQYGPESTSWTQDGGVAPNSPDWQNYINRTQASGQAEAARQDAASGGGLFDNPLGLLAAGAGLYFGLPALFGEMGAGAGMIGSGMNAGALSLGGLPVGYGTALSGTAGALLGTAAGAGLGSSAMDFTDLWDYGGKAVDGGLSNWQNAIPDFTNYTGQMTQIPGLEQTLTQIPNDFSLTSLQTALAGSNPGLLDQVTNWMKANPGATAKMALQALSGGATALGGLLTGNAAVDAANKTAQTQMAIANKAFEQSRFQPVGITNNPFGTAQYQYDANGRLIGAQATPSAQLKAQQDALMANSGQMLSQYTNAPSQFAPMGQAGQTAMALGNSYLSTTPQQQAQKYMADQQALLATGRERDMNQMLTGEFNRGTYGLSTGSTSTGMMGANPRLEAMFNAQRQQDLGLAAQATQGGMDYAKFGTGMVGLGGDLTKGMYTGQTAAYDPYKTALGGAQAVQGLGESALTQGMDFGRLANNTGAANTLQQGMLSAAQTQQKADSFSPWGSLLSGAGNIAQQYANPQQTQGMATYNPNQFRLVPFGS